MEDLTIERRLRRVLARHDMRLCKVPARSWIRPWYGVGYMVVDDRNTVRLGAVRRAYEATLADVSTFAAGLS